ncbi:MAG: hypothetical protein R3B84_07705 [Zavarzinella sp.]
MSKRWGQVNIHPTPKKLQDVAGQGSMETLSFYAGALARIEQYLLDQNHQSARVLLTRLLSQHTIPADVASSAEKLRDQLLGAKVRKPAPHLLHRISCPVERLFQRANMACRAGDSTTAAKYLRKVAQRTDLTKEQFKTLFRQYCNIGMYKRAEKTIIDATFRFADASISSIWQDELAARRAARHQKRLAKILTFTHFDGADASELHSHSDDCAIIRIDTGFQHRRHQFPADGAGEPLKAS